MKIFVIAGTSSQALDWIRNNQKKRYANGDTDIGMGDYVIVSGVNKLLGVRDPHGVFVGTWKQRVDLVQILNQLYAISPNNPLWRTLIGAR